MLRDAASGIERSKEGTLRDGRTGSGAAARRPRPSRIARRAGKAHASGHSSISEGEIQSEIGSEMNGSEAYDSDSSCVSLNPDLLPGRRCEQPRAQLVHSTIVAC